jgi:hypothetical protein
MYFDGQEYHWPQKIETDLRLDLIFPNKFALVGDAFIPRPRRLGRRVLLEMKTVPRSQMREGGDDTMAKFVKVRQNLMPVPENAGITKQHVTVLEGDTILLDGDFPVALSPDEMPSYWAEVGAGVTVRVYYADDLGNVSDTYEDNYVQDGMPEPEPTPEPTPEPEPEPTPPEPTPEPTPEPVPLTAPVGLGPRELIDQVDSESRPVQARRKFRSFKTYRKTPRGRR